jgi:hypothetical protein
MKNSILFFGVVLFMNPARSQDTKQKGGKDAVKSKFLSKIYAKLYAGDGILTPGSYSVESSNSVNWTNPPGYGQDTSARTQAAKGIGGSLRLGGGLGYVLNDFVNIGIDVEYQKGTKLRNSLNTFIDAINFDSAYDAMSYRAITLTPHIIFKALSRPGYFIYNKIGVLLTLPFTLHTSGISSRASTTSYPNSFTYHDGVFYPNSTFSISDKSNSNYDNKDKISLGIGLNVAFGINVRVNNKFRAFGEIFGIYTALSPASSTSSNYSKSSTIISIDTTNFHLETPYRDISYSTTYTTFQNNGPVAITSSSSADLGNTNDGYHESSSTTSGRSHKYNFNMAALGINVGITYRF